VLAPALAARLGPGELPTPLSDLVAIARRHLD
jgi:hypothetical protein